MNGSTPARGRGANTPSLIVRAERIVTPDGVRAGAIWIADGRIVRVAVPGDCPAGVPVLDAGQLVILPGFVDTHVHVNDPGRTDWEGFAHATRAAAAAGVTTIVDMPLNSVPPTTDAAALQAKLRAAEGACEVDVGFWGGVVPGNEPSLPTLARDGVLGFKCFLSPSGVEEFPHVTESDLGAAMPILSALGLPLLVHAELPALLRVPEPRADPASYRTWLETRPAASECAAIELLVRLAVRWGVHVHIVHVACGEGVEVLSKARAQGARVTGETCPHYLTFAAEEIPHGATAFKCAPPIRERSQREQLWEALRDGRLDVVASDHSPAPASMKCVDTGSFLQAWGGIASLQLAPRAVWTGAAARGLPLDLLARWMAERPARLAGLDGRKGAIAPGFDADLVAWSPDDFETVDPSALHHRHPLTPYAGLSLRGRAAMTLLRGEVVYRDGQLTGARSGRAILRRPQGA